MARLADLLADTSQVQPDAKPSLAALLGEPAAAPKTATPEPLGLFEKVFSGPEYAGAGKLDELLGGGPHELTDRVEYGDLLRKYNVPDWLAAPTGFAAATIMDPLNLIPAVPAAKMAAGIVEGYFKLGKFGRVYKALKEVGELAHELPPAFKDVARELPDLGSARAVEARSGAAAAKEAFAGIMGTQTRETAPDLFKEATGVARKAAAEARKSMPRDLSEGSDPLLLGNWYSKMLDRFGDKTWMATTDDMLKQLQHGWIWFGRNLGDAMRTDMRAWGPLGPEMAAKFEYTTRLAAAAEGRYQSYLFSKKLDKLPLKMRHHLSEVLAGEAAPANDAVAKLAAELRALDARLAKDAADSGIKMLVPVTHSAGQMDLFPEMATKRAEMLQAINAPIDGTPIEKIVEALEKGGPDAEKWSKRFKLIPFTPRQNHVYKMRDPKFMRALTTEGTPERKAAIEKLLADYSDIFTSPKSAADYLDNILESHADPFDIRGGPLQHSREGLLDELGVPWEKDIAKWAPKYVHTAAKRLAQASVFGSRDQLWREQFLPSIVEAHGDTRQADEVWRAFVGRPNFSQSIGMDVYQKVRALQTLRLGPRVGALQLLQVANINAKMGNKATGAAVGALIKDPSLTRAARVVGALLPSQHFAYDASDLDNFSSWWIKHMTAMPYMDRGNRVIASIASGYKLNDIAEKLATASGGKRRILERQLYDLGVDAGQLAKNDFKPTLAQMQVAMERGSKMTQFTTDVLDLPAAARHNAFTRTMFIFRGFAKQQSTFVNTLVREARQGNWAPLTTYLSFFPGMYNAAEPVLQVLQGKNYEPAKDEGAWEYVKTLAFTGGLGSMGDALVAGGDTGRLLKGQVGPAVSQALDIGTGVAALPSGESDNLRRALLRALPGGLGTVIINQNK